MSMRALATWFFDLPLARKLSWLAMGAVVIAIAACAVAVFSVEFVVNRQQAYQQFATLADVVARNSTAALAFNNASDARDVLSVLSQDADIQAAWILKPDRTVFAEYQSDPTNPRSLPPRHTAETGHKWSSRNLVLERPIVVSNEILGTVVVDYSLRAFWQNLAFHIIWMSFVTLAVLAGVYGLLKRFLRRVTTPILDLATVARQVTRDQNYSLRAQTAGQDETGQLVEAFNHMLQAIQARDAELEQARATLEQRVQERTEALQQEILERRQIEEDLRRSEQRFAQIFRSSPVPTILRGLNDHKIIEVNDSFLRLFGFQREEVLGRTIEELGLNPDAAKVKEISDNARRQGNLRDVEIHWRGKGGKSGTARLFGEVIEWIKEPCLLVMIYDTTRQAKMERQLRQAQKMEAVGQLAAGVAHDFNNILTVIQANASLGQSEPGLDPVLKDCFDQISLAAERAAALTRQLLAFSRKQAMQPTAVDLNQLLVDYAAMLRRAATERVKVEYNLNPEVPPIHADPTMVEQVLTNLTLNARDAMPNGGQLVIATEEVELDQEFAQHHPRAREGRFVRMQVTDTGVGIPADLLPRIFDPFFTTKEVGKGSGLGLAAVHGIVDAHGGWVEVESETGRGATFSVFWPVHTGEHQLPGKQGDTTVIRGGNETILLVEDEPAVRGIARHILKKYGYSVVEAISGKAALKLWPAICPHISLVVTDVVMPDGVSGRQLAEELRRTKPELPVLMVSGYSPELAGMDTQQMAGCHFLAKPFKPAELARLVRDMLDQTKTTHGGNGNGKSSNGDNGS